MVAFAGLTVPEDVLGALSAQPYAGVTLFRHWNVSSPEQVRALTATLQAAAVRGPLLIAADQEGGQLNALGVAFPTLPGPTPFAGAMALGAAADEGLCERVAAATGRELRALGANVNYAPVCDLATNPLNPALGVRCFGDDPVAVGGLAAAYVRGIQSAGVAACVKHFPGLGDVAVDTHHGAAAAGASRDELERRELVPFAAAIAAGARLAMAAHLAVPALTGEETLPASLSPAVLNGILRSSLGFAGLTITDALDMAAVATVTGLRDPMKAALEAGEDLLLGTPMVALRDVSLEASDEAPVNRLAALRDWLASFEQPDLAIVGCADHVAIAKELAARSITLVRDDDGLLPLRLPDGARILVIEPQPADLTPADTTSLVAPTLALAVRGRHGRTDEVITSAQPAAAEIATLRERAKGYDLVVVGTIAAHLQPSHEGLSHAVLGAGVPTISVALRTPWDLTAYPEARTHVATYGCLAPSTDALAAALFGERDFGGRLPVVLGDLYPRGHGLGLGATAVSG